jgi:hypothetical protein
MIPATSTGATQALSRDRRRPIHLQFADSGTDDQLLAFVRAHGPIWGRVQGKTRGNDQKENLLVGEDMRALVREQRLFRAAVRLVRALKGTTESLVTIRTLISQIRRYYPSDILSEKRVKSRAALAGMMFALADQPPPGDPKRTTEAVRQQRIRSAAIRYNAVSAGHGVLCDLFNRFPLRLFPCSNGVIELPSYDREGILPILYYLLRRDFQDQHHWIKACRVCDTTFKPERGDSDFCGRACYKKYNDRERYLRKKHH